MKRALLCLTALSLLVLAGACTNTELNPIFYALEIEQPLQEDRGLADNITVQALAESASAYFAAANTLYTRARADTTGAPASWEAVTPPQAGALCNSVAVVGGVLYAGFFDRVSGAGLGLWRTDPATISWSRVSDTGGYLDGVVQISGLFPLGGTNLGIATARDSGGTFTYALITGDISPATPTLNAALTGSENFQDALYDGAASYYAIAGNTLYKGTLAAPAALGTAPTSTLPYGGLHWDGANLYISSGDGTLFRSSDSGATWTASGAAVTVGSDTVAFGRFAGLDSGDVVAATNGYGYYLLPGGDVAAAGLVRSPDYTITNLYNAVILSFLHVPAASDPAGVERLFACTSGAGLWRGDYLDGAWQWKQE